MTEYKNYPLSECVKAADRIVKEQRGQVFQKWTCFRCKERKTAETPNLFTSYGHCIECGYVTDIEKSGCNYVAIFSVPQRKGG
jgi:hypothetical protein